MNQSDIKRSLKVGDWFWLEKGECEYSTLRGAFQVEGCSDYELIFNSYSAINFNWDSVIIYPIENNLSKLIFLGE